MMQKEITEGQWAVLNLCSDHYVFSLRIPFINITMQTIYKLAVTKRRRRKITEGQWTVLNIV